MKMYRQLFFLFFSWSVSCQEEVYTTNEEQIAVPGIDEDLDLALVEFPEGDFGDPDNQNLEERLLKLEDRVSKLQKACSSGCKGIQDEQHPSGLGCPKEYIWNKDLNFCYKIHDDSKMKWATARTVCASEVRGGRLAIFDTDEKRQAVHATIKQGTGQPKNYFVGAQKMHGDFKWTDDTAMTNVTWCEGQPSGTDCGSLWGRMDYCMDDVPCRDYQAFVCEKSMK